MAAILSLSANILLDRARDVTYSEAKLAFGARHSDLSAVDSRLQAFQAGLDSRSSGLAAQTEGVPSQEALLGEAIEFATDFEELCCDLNATATKAKVFAGEFARVIEFLTPRPRAYADQKSVEQHTPALKELMESTDTTCTAYVKDLSENMTTLMTLHDKMLKQILGPTPSSLQVFCQIVDNKGQSKGWMDTAYNMLPTIRSAPIPTAASLQAKLDAVKAEAIKKAEAGAALNVVPT